MSYKDIRANPDFTKPLSAAEIKEIRTHVMCKLLDEDKPGDGGHLLLRVLHSYLNLLDAKA